MMMMMKMMMMMMMTMMTVIEKALQDHSRKIKGIQTFIFLVVISLIFFFSLNGLRSM